MDIFFVNFKHLYIHWPFCKNKCYYCNFLSYCNKGNFFKKYHAVLCKQVSEFSNNQKNKQYIKTVFLGGGTPSLYPLSLLEELFSVINKNFNVKDLQEITIESNPRDISIKKLEVWNKIGINRLSIGVQLLDDNILKKMGRNQSVSDVLNAIEIALSYFDNISVDLILGLPGSNRRLWFDTLYKVTSWPIKHISVYILSLYKGTNLFHKIKNEEIFLEKDDKISALYIDTVKFLENEGFLQYEISNFAKPGFESLHNIAYWDRKPYLGLGLGASSFDGVYRFVNEKNMEKFLQKTGKFFLEEAYREKVTEEQKFLEVLMLGLRQKKGVDLHSMLYFLKDGGKDLFLSKLEMLKKQKLIRLVGGRMFLTLNGMLLENEVILKLI